ncbi:toluene-4-monooxygenase system B family protein [Mycolicibacter icosiumassiliensis]|uniref:toluene-4-monooxygenase system B family protein n=1 Tax=Mycolicibacter icosiumassiliensis TaxID=1792835 RepID=UPI00082DA1EA|nr:toluene-4-monooxygenase system B family protein [Mycolicibacter icosiumassiliensis]
MAPLPVQGLVEGDFVVQLVPIDSDDTMDVVAGKLAHHSVNRRVAPQNKPLRVRFNGQVLPADATPASVGIAPLDFVEAYYQEQS